MSRGNKKEKAKKLVNEPSKICSTKEVCTRKRSKENDDFQIEVNSNTEMAFGKLAKSKKSVKRKIDFSEGKAEMQQNNNATKTTNVVDINNKKVCKANDGEKDISGCKTRSKRAMSMPTEGKVKSIKLNDLADSRVQWTKEFMEKVRKSNEKHNKIVKPNNRQNFVMSLQHKEDRGDGICTMVENTGNLSDEEELDYEDDISMEDGLLTTEEDFPDVTDEKETVPQPIAGTSEQSNKAFTSTADLAEQSKEQLMNNPVIQRMMQKFFTDQFKNLQQQEQNKVTGKVPEVSGKNKLKGVGRVVKSPSDTTIYVPAMQKKLTPTGVGVEDFWPMVNLINDDAQHTQVQIQDLSTEHENVDSRQLEPQQCVFNDCGNMRFNNETGVNAVTCFVENIRIDQHPQDAVNRRQSDVAAASLESVQKKAERSILEAEKFRASVEAPGMDSNINILNIGSGVSDNDFFHLTCHIEPNLIHKIEKGEFVELEKLLPKEKLGANKEESRLEWVQRDGGTYLVPAQRDSKIGSFRRWEQVFRAYTTIYCGANPHRSKEIWQYITVTNTAASSYIWDNVYNYNTTFRHLMAFNPQRSWAVTYNQMWNLSMKDPIPKNYGKQNAYSHYSGSGIMAQPMRMSTTGSNLMQVRRNKSDYCWNFNKGVPCKFGSRCKFVERCKFCDSPSHGVNACSKLLKKEGVNKGPNGSMNAQNSNANDANVSK